MSKRASRLTKESLPEVPKPQIESIRILNAEGEEIDTIRYGQKIFIEVVTKDAFACNLVLTAKNTDWKEPEKRLEKKWRVSPTIGTAIKDEGTLISFLPQAEWLKDIEEHSEKTVFEVSLASSIRYSFYMGWKNEQEADNKKSKEIDISPIIVVIDPGHGYSIGFTGTQCRGFEYYLQDEKGDLDKTKTTKAKASSLPDYVLDDINKWIIKWVDLPVTKEEQEWFYVIDIAIKLLEKLEKEKLYNVIMTREVEKKEESRVQLAGSDIYSNRRKVVNDNKADYFISIHCDGQASFKNTGAFVVIPRDVDTNSEGDDVKKSRQLGQDLMDNYSIINPDAKPVQQVTEKAVLREGNSAQRRVIVELGRMTNPHDIKKLYADGNKDRIAEQLKEGIIFNIKNRV